jgi:hypothetical protein
MERWNWFLSANFLGKWIIVHGYAEVTQSDDIIRAILWCSSDVPHYAYVEVSDNIDGTVHALMRYRDDPETPQTPPHTLQGKLYRDYVPTVNSAESIILTDGNIVLGLAKGPRSDDGNDA